MKLNKSKNKGKVHPSPPPSIPPSSSSSNDPISSLNHLLPTAILTLISILSLQDREALAYMITHSLKSSTLNCTFDSKKNPKKTNKKYQSNTNTTHPHSSPSFDCCCFDCFSHFWNRWDSSPHSELIHQAIEAFEEHLSCSEKKKNKKKDNSRSNHTSNHSSSKKREKMGFPVADVEERESCTGSSSTNVDDDVEVVKSCGSSPEKGDVEEREREDTTVVAGGDEVEERESGTQNEEKKMLQQQQHKGLARKVLPDFIGFFHSRLWNLWGPNV